MPAKRGRAKNWVRAATLASKVTDSAEDEGWERGSASGGGKSALELAKEEEELMLRAAAREGGTRRARGICIIGDDG